MKRLCQIFFIHFRAANLWDGNVTIPFLKLHDFMFCRTKDYFIIIIKQKHCPWRLFRVFFLQLFYVNHLMYIWLLIKIRQNRSIVLSYACQLYSYRQVWHTVIRTTLKHRKKLYHTYIFIQNNFTKYSLS